MNDFAKEVLENICWIMEANLTEKKIIGSHFSYHPHPRGDMDYNMSLVSLCVCGDKK